MCGGRGTGGARGGGAAACDPLQAAWERVANAGQRIYVPRAVGRVRLVEAAQQRQRDLVLVVAGSGVSGPGAAGAGRRVASRGRLLASASVVVALSARVGHFLAGPRGLGAEAGERALAAECEAPHGRAARRFPRRRRHADAATRHPRPALNPPPPRGERAHDQLPPLKRSEVRRRLGGCATWSGRRVPDDGLRLGPSLQDSFSGETRARCGRVES